MNVKRICLSIALLLGFSLPGCMADSSRPEITVSQFVLSYEPVSAAAAAPFNDFLRIERFTAAREFSDQAMVFQPQPYARQPYVYHRWRAYPADLVTDMLLRDFRHSSLFAGVMSYQNPGPYRYRLEGSVEEFYQEDLGGSSQAVLGLNITLSDVSRQELPLRLVFQKPYRAVVAMSEQSAPALAQAMSQALRQISSELTADMAAALQARQ